jgi:putative ABC transport system permease protein
MRRVVGRLAAGVTATAAAGELDSLLQHPAEGHLRHGGSGMTMRVEELKTALVGDVQRLLWILAGAVGCILLVACANVANLLLARGAGRRREVALRTALGASRMRLVQQMLTESLVLAIIGGVGGLFIARWSLALALALVPENKLPRTPEIALDATGFAFTALLCLLTALVVGAIPAFTGSNVDVNEPLQQGSDRSTTPEVVHVRSLLVVGEIALVLVLLTGAGLLVKSFWRLHNVDPGFQPDGVLTLQIELPERVYETIEQRKAFYDRVLTRLQAVPGAANPSLINLLPFGEMLWMGDFDVEGRTDPLELLAGKPAVSIDYFRTVGIRLVRGRLFDARDREGAERVTIVSEAVARAAWPDLDPIGRRIKMDSRGDAWLTVVGVVSDVKQNDLAGKRLPMIYVPYAQEWRPFFLTNVALLTRVAGNAGAIADGIRRAVYDVDRDLPVSNVAMLDQLLARSVSEPRFRAGLFVAFGGLALVLACVGIAGLVAYDVTRRTREIGIRLALGAQPADVVRMVMQRSGRLIATGVALGLVLALALSRLLSDFLFSVTPDDPATFVLVGLSIAAAAAAAAFVPARRATRIQPTIALRYE